MSYIDGFFKKNRKSKKNEENKLVIQDYELNGQFSNLGFEVIAIEGHELRALRRVFEPIVREAVKGIERKGVKPERVIRQ